MRYALPFRQTDWEGVIMASSKKKRKRKQNRLGFSNRLALYILLFLAAGLAGGFYLALKSIEYQYTGALMCWTVVFTPIGTAISIVPHFIVHKSTVENRGADGEGIKYAAAKATGFNESCQSSNNSPAI